MKTQRGIAGLWWLSDTLMRDVSRDDVEAFLAAHGLDSERDEIMRYAARESEYDARQEESTCWTRYHD